MFNIALNFCYMFRTCFVNFLFNTLYLSLFGKKNIHLAYCFEVSGTIVYALFIFLLKVTINNISGYPRVLKYLFEQMFILAAALPC